MTSMTRKQPGRKRPKAGSVTVEIDPDNPGAVDLDALIKAARKKMQAKRK